MAQIEGSICSKCYADKGFYAVYQNTIKPAQFARLDAVQQALQSAENAELWISGMVSLIGNDSYFRWHDSGDLQSVHHLNLIVRLSAMYSDQPVKIPASLQGIKGITASNVHTKNPIGNACNAPSQNGECRDCRLCWSDAVVSYALH